MEGSSDGESVADNASVSSAAGDAEEEMPSTEVVVTPDHHHPHPRLKRDASVLDTMVDSVFGGMIRHSQLESDSKEVRGRKRQVIPLACILFVLSFATLVRDTFGGHWFLVGIHCVVLVIASTTLFFALVLRRLPLWQVEASVLGMLLCVQFFDISSGGVREYWLYSLILIDIALLIRCRDTVLLVACIISVVFITLRTSEDIVGFGLYRSFHGGFPEREPLGWDDGSHVLVVRVMVYLFDFIVTRTFATGMRQQAHKAEKCLEITKKVGAALVRLDLDHAEELTACIENEPELQEVWMGLLNNLRLYRPYLPDTLFARVSKKRSSRQETPTVKYVPTPLPERTEERKSAMQSRLALGLHPCRVVQLDVQLDSFDDQTTVSSYPSSPRPRSRSGKVLNPGGNAGAMTTSLLNNFIAMVVEKVRTHRGSIQWFAHGRAVATWGAAAVIGNASSRACRCAMDLVSTMHGDMQNLRPRIAVVCGRATAGNVGCDSIRVHLVHGQVLNTRRKMLASLAVHLGIPCLACPDTAASAEGFVMRPVDVLSGGDVLGIDPLLVYHVQEDRPSASPLTEWFTTGFNALLQGSSSRAVRAFTEHITMHSTDVVAQRLLTLANSLDGHPYHRNVSPAPFTVWDHESPAPLPPMPPPRSSLFRRSPGKRNSRLGVDTGSASPEGLLLDLLRRRSSIGRDGQHRSDRSPSSSTTTSWDHLYQ